MIREKRYGEVTRFDLARNLGGRGWYWTTCHVVDGLAIDTGCARTAGELLASLSGVPVDTIVSTHSHEDHIGGNGPLQRKRPRIEVRAHPLALAALEDPRRLGMEAYRRLAWGVPEPCRARALLEGQVVRTPRYSFQVLETPGHARDHLCLFEPDQGWLFSGDLYVGGRDRALREEYDVRAIIASLKRVAALPVRMLFPGAARVPHDPRAALREKIDYLERLGERIEGLARAGRTEAEIVRIVLGGPMLMEALTQGCFARKYLVRSFLRSL